MDIAELKKVAGYKAIDDHVESGMKVGLGTGSTAAFAVERLAQKIASGELTDIVAVPTSEATKALAEAGGIPLTTLDELDAPLAVTIDGADTVDSQLNLVKGGGGALLREKLVETRSDKFVVIVDESKISPAGIGVHFPIPVEIIPFCYQSTIRVVERLSSLQAAGVTATLRLGNVSNNKKDGDEIAITDNGNYIVDLSLAQPLADPAATAAELIDTVGVVEHGLFCGMAHSVIVASSEGIQVMD